MATRARDVAAGRVAIAPARAASTVLLLRDGAAGGLEVYLHHRHAEMPFAPAAVAFPGGAVEPIDHLGDDPMPEWVGQLGAQERKAHGFVAAAIRETREETGVVLAAEQLKPWAHWVTPRFWSSRFDTWFFIAGLTAGQRPEDVSGETSGVEWTAPADAVRRAEQGEFSMLRPTWSVLTELGRYSSVADALTAASRRTIAMIVPGWLDDGTTVRILMPGDEEYPGDDPGDPEPASSAHCHGPGEEKR